MSFLKKAILFLSITVFVQSKAQTVVGFITCPNDDTVCVGTTGLMTLNGGISPIVRWELSTDGGVNWNPLTTVTSTQYSYFSIPNSTCYRVVHDGGNAVSQIYCITTDEPSDAGTITGGGQQCGIANDTMVVTSGVGAPLGWYYSTGGTYISIGDTNDSLAYNVTGTTYYAYVVKNGVCPADTARDTISITPYSNAGIASTDSLTVCITSNAVTVSVPNGSTTGTNMGWQTATSLSGPWTTVGDSTDSYSVINLSTPTYYHLLVKSGICPSDTSNDILINVDAAPVGGSLSGATYHCGAPPATGTLNLSGHSGTVLNWWLDSGSGWIASPCSGTSCNYSVTTNTLYRVEIGNGVCPSVFSTYDTITISPLSVAGTLTQTEDTICAFSSGGVLSLNGYTANDFNWEISNDGSTWLPLAAFTGPNAAYSNLPSGTLYFHCIVTNNLCPPVTSNSATVVVSPSPTVTILTNDTTIDQGETISVVATGTGTPSWSPAIDVSNPNSFITDITAYAPESYVITVDDGSGCTGTDTLHIYMTVKPFSGFIANSLTPNNDGINDAFYVENIEVYKTSSVKIFNEYGQLIYSAAPYTNDWKGTYNNARVADGTYYYVLTLKDIDKEKEFKGYISILGGK
ncbi:MAG: gliding motility-associated C-terminal domain-containing protein [Bacteroidota bacterium]|nr:gliding motility-associated C-terminal domain-containing protein [Bacteroidota bacterium]